VISLYPYQVPSAENLLRSLRENRVAVSASDTGTGKTYEAAWIAKQLDCEVFVVCPKAVIPVWENVLKQALGNNARAAVVNYELLRMGNTSWGRFNVKKWEWSLNPGCLVIFDEVHRCKSPTSQNARILAAAKPFRCLLLSATLAQDPTEMRAVGYLLGLHTWTNFYKWCLRNGCWRGAFGGIEFKRKSAAKVLVSLHEQIFPKFGSRIRIADLGDAFPDNSVNAEVYAFGNEAQVNAAYDAAAEEKNRRILAGESVQGGVLIMQARQKAEVLKADGLASMATDLIAEGNSVVVFTSFRETLEKLRTKLKCDGIYGGQNDAERQKAIADFQADKSRAIIVNVQAGGVGISLHDLHGRYPRVSLICPTDHAVDLKQALGRIHRAGAKSKAVQKIVFAAGTYEEKVCKRVQAKLANIALLQDGDLDPLEELAGGRATTEAVKSTCQPKFTNKSDLACEVADTSYTAVLSSPEPTTERKHAPLSPSVLKSKAICPGYFSDPDGDRTFADRGTLAHKAVETEDLSLIAHDAILKAAVEKCVEYKRQVLATYRVTPSVFQEIRLDYFDQFGYTDVLAHDGLVADIIDWKFAYNFYPADAPQFHCYAIGTWDKFPVETVRIHAVHPLRDEIDIETFTRSKDYDRLSGQVAAIIARARANRPEDYTVSAQCQYCGFAGKCTKLANLGLEIARRYSPELDLPEGSLHGSEITDPEAFATLMQIAPAVTKAASGWKSAALYMHESGTQIPGYEIAEKRGRRSVVSAKAAFDVIKTEVAPELKADDFVEYCDIKASAVDDLVKAVSKRGQKAKAVQRVQDLLIEGDIFNQAGDVRYLKPIRK